MLAQKVLQKYWGHDNFREMQPEIIEAVLAKKDVLAILPTGGGKSVCFQVPALITDGICIVISPLIALMKDQVQQLREKHIPAYEIHSGMSKREIDIVLDNCIYGKVKFLYCSPERLLTTIFIERVKQMKVSLIAIDEAHCISQWGHDFRPAYTKITSLKEVLANVPFMALTASADAKTQEDIITHLELKNPEIFIKSFAIPQLSYNVIITDDKDSKLLALSKKITSGVGIVYVKSRKLANSLGMMLHQEGIPVAVYHAGLSREVREQQQNKWMKGTAKIMVATNAFGMGINKQDVRMVIHYHLPETLEAYYQEAGRAGRDGNEAHAVLLFQQNDADWMLKNLAEENPDEDLLRRVYQSLANYFKIAVGSSEFVSYELDLMEFERVYSLPPRQTFYAIKQLEREGFILFNESYYQPSKVLFLVDNKTVLYEFQIKNKNLDPVIKLLLRVHGGEIFTDFTLINEPFLASHLNTSIVDLQLKLQFLHKAGIIVYQQSTDKPQLTFLTARQDANKMPINMKKLKLRYDNQLNKLNKAVDYAKQSLQCRQQILCSYFGEQNPKACGKCDVCKSKAKINISDKQLFSYFKPEGIDAKEYLNKFEIHQHDYVKKWLREALNNGIIARNSDGFLVLAKGS